MIGDLALMCPEFIQPEDISWIKPQLVSILINMTTRRYMGHKITIRPNAKLSALFLQREKMSWGSFSSKVKSAIFKERTLKRKKK
ncbi:unnamed protein product [Lactuca virosa]|uniref:Uncharacterized protein n=1 Tax=Lactuca virosa TaxID=75947 RepID=A0AAU9LUL9_9ASTR|nr:unnamed protein product [Lactuca virosa]